ERLLSPATEKIGDVGILLRLGNTQLAAATLGDHLTERLREVDLRECDRQIERLVIGREDCKMHIQPLSPIEAVEIGVREGPRELASAISAEVEEDDTVAVLNPHDLAVPSDENRLDEFVRHI